MSKLHAVASRNRASPGLSGPWLHVRTSLLWHMHVDAIFHFGDLNLSLGRKNGIRIVSIELIWVRQTSTFTIIETSLADSVMTTRSLGPSR